MIANSRIGSLLLAVTLLAAAHGASQGSAADETHEKRLESLASQDSSAFASYHQLRDMITRNDDVGELARKDVVDRLLAEVDNERIQLELLRVRETEPLHAAALALEVFHARLWAKPKGSTIVAGQVVIDDGQIDVRASQGQTLVGEGGYFATAIGDPMKPIGFALQGYQPIFAKGHANQNGFVWLGRLRLRRDEVDAMRTLHGQIRIFGDIGPDEISSSLFLAPPIINTPTGGYHGAAQVSGEPLPTVSISDPGSIHAAGFSPTVYWLSLTADGYSPRMLVLDFTGDEGVDLGTIPFLCADIGYYAKTEPPGPRPVKWEKSYAAAALTSRDEGRPLLVMFSTEPCAPCMMLEQTTLKNPWIEQLLSPFVAVKVMQNQELQEEILGHGVGYPTLAFVDPEGNLVHNITGFQESMFFAQECAKAYEKLKLDVPMGIERLLNAFEQAHESSQQTDQEAE